MSMSMTRKFLLAAAVLLSAPVMAADHGDIPLRGSLNRNDAKLSDLHVFRNGDSLVIALSTNTGIPVGATSFPWSQDTRFTIHLDNRAQIDYSDAAANATHGGTIVNPGAIQSRVQFVVTFDENGQAQLDASGVHGKWRREVKFFAGLRDDPFIRVPRQGRNVNAIVIEVPLKGVQHSEAHQTFLAWGTSEVTSLPPETDVPSVDLAGRALRNMFPENDALNILAPRDHYLMEGKAPDVVIFDAGAAAGFPNGRLLTDDVVDQVNDPRVANASESPSFPTANDKPFLAEFPYLAAPW